MRPDAHGGAPAPGLLREDMTTDDLTRSWLLPLALASDATTEATAARRFMLAAIRAT